MLVLHLPYKRFRWDQGGKWTGRETFVWLTLQEVQSKKALETAGSKLVIIFWVQPYIGQKTALKGTVQR